MLLNFFIIDDKLDYELKTGPLASRSCNDIFCLITFLGTWAFMVFLALNAYRDGDIKKVINPYDSVLYTIDKRITINVDSRSLRTTPMFILWIPIRFIVSKNVQGMVTKTNHYNVRSAIMPMLFMRHNKVFDIF